VIVLGSMCSETKLGHVEHAGKVEHFRYQTAVCDHGQVSRSPDRPAERVERDLRTRIAAGEWESGQQLPTVIQLAEHYEVSRGTVAKVIKRLADDGLVRTVRAWGTFKT
jgi:biotin operon repressor